MCEQLAQNCCGPRNSDSLEETPIGRRGGDQILLVGTPALDYHQGLPNQALSHQALRSGSCCRFMLLVLEESPAQRKKL